MEYRTSLEFGHPLYTFVCKLLKVHLNYGTKYVFPLFQENTLAKLKQILELQNVRAKDALRLVALFTIRYTKEVEKNMDLICGAVQGKMTCIFLP